ncbi:restriction endonuclease subunit S, partial [Mesoplasma coleopterae]|uniref:restriction endonuclease subunit S n=1 Tax=Mesoplasma coleopterae TaxID=324078 RepID=UPI000D2049F5
ISKFKSDEYKIPVVSNGIGNSQIMGYTDKTNISENSITISARGTVGFVSLWQEPIFPIVRLLTIKCSKKVIPIFLFYKLKTIIFFSTGAVQKQITKPMILKLELEIPSLEEQQKIIDIIEPFENAKNYFHSINETILNFIKNINISEHKVKIDDFFLEKKESSRNIEQISAKVLSENKGLVLKSGVKGTYKTNTFFCKEGTFLFCSIRTYLRKWAITPFDADVNGTLFQFQIKNNITSLLNYLQNDNSWNTFNLLSKGTKMPVISKSDFLNIQINKTNFDLENIDLILKTINKILLILEKLIVNNIKLLIK